MKPPLQWIEETLVFPPESDLAGKKLKGYLLPFQKLIIRSALTSDGLPNKNIFLGFSRKWGKSAVLEWILLYLLTQKVGYHSAILASSGLQSEIIYNGIRQQIQFNPAFCEKDFNITREMTKFLPGYSSIEKLYFSHSGAGLLGKRLSCLVSDECAAQKDDSCFRAITSGMTFAKFGRPLILCASNPPDSPGNWTEDFLAQRKKDPGWKVFEYKASPKLEPFSKEALIAANPLYSAYHSDKKKYKYLAGVANNLDQESKNAQKSPQEALSFIRFQLGRKILTKEAEWINGDQLKVAKLEDVLQLKTRVTIGIDLALSYDICAACIGFHTKDKMFIHPVMHLPNLDTRTDKQIRQFREWEQLNFLTIQNRRTLDKQSFLQEIKNFVSGFRLSPRAVIWDKGLSSTEWEDSLRYGKSFLVPGTGQNLAAPIAEMQAKARAGRLYIIGENLALRHFFSSAFTSERSKSYRILNRPSNRQSIDICQASLLSQWWILKNPLKKAVIMAV